MALVDSNYKYIMIDVGAAGSEDNSNTFRNSAFRQLFHSDRIPFPLPENLPGTTTQAPYVLVGDKAFPGELHLLKPYSKKTKTISEKRLFSITDCPGQGCVLSVHSELCQPDSGFSSSA